MLDAGWDRRLARGLVAPDVTIDLHDHSLDRAHQALMHTIARALAADVRTILVITGKPREYGAGSGRRGAIRAEIADWIAVSPFAGMIAAIRGAHPRHGGIGALYLVLRRRRDANSSRKN